MPAMRRRWIKTTLAIYLQINTRQQTMNKRLIKTSIIRSVLTDTVRSDVFVLSVDEINGRYIRFQQ